MEEHRGLIGEKWQDFSRYEDLPEDVRLPFETDLETLRLIYPESMHATSAYIIGSWGMGNAWALGDIDVVFANDDDSLAPALREQWLSISDQEIRNFAEEVSMRHEIRVEYSFGLKPVVGYDVALQQVIGRQPGVSLKKKCVFNKELGVYEMTDLPIITRPRGSYLDAKQRRHWL